MSDPRRLRQGGDGFERSLLESLHLDMPTDADRRRGLAMLGIVLPAAVPLALTATSATSATTAATAATRATLGATGAVKAVAVVALAIAGASLGLAIVDARRPPSGSLPAQVASSAVAIAAPLASSDPEPRHAAADEPPLVDVASLPRARPVATASPVAASASPASPASLADEIARIDRVRDALAKGDFSGALALLDAEQGQGGALAHEAAALRVEALVQRGDTAEATRVARAFLAAHPKSPLADRMRARIHLDEDASIP